MKTKNLLFAGIIAMVMLCNFNQATGQQWANNGTHIYNVNTGNVGIGTGVSFTPTDKLHVNNLTNSAGIMAESSYSGTSQKAYGYFRIKSTASGDMFNLVLRRRDGRSEMLQSCYDALNATWREYTYFDFANYKYEMRGGVGDAEFMNSGHFLLNNTGNVGINTSTPYANLHVAKVDDTYTAAFGTLISEYYNWATNVCIGDATSPPFLYLGQDISHKGFINWHTDANLEDTYLGVGVYNGIHPLILQEVGGNVGIQTTTPQAVLDVKLNNYNYVRLGDNETQPNYFYHNEDATDGDYQNAIYAYRDRLSQNGGIDYSYDGTNCAIYGLNFWGDPYTFGATGYSYFDYNRCGGVLGSHWSGNTWGSLAYYNSGATAYGGYFTSSTTGAGKGSQGFYSKIGLAAWGDLFGADIHGKVYGVFAEGENYALYSHGTTYKDDLDVHLQENASGTNTVMYTNVSTDVTIQTSGVATLTSGRTIIEFDPSFAAVVSSQEPIIITVTPIGESNGVYLSEVTSAGFTVIENNAGKSNVKVNYIAIGKRAGYEEPQLAKEVVAHDYVSKLGRGLHNDNDIQTDGVGLYYENGQLIVGSQPNLPDQNRIAPAPVDKLDRLEYGPSGARK